MDKIDKWDIRDRELLRQLRYLSVIGPSVLPPDQLNRVSLGCFATPSLHYAVCCYNMYVQYVTTSSSKYLVSTTYYLGIIV